jgi:hypothetical protein
MASRPDTVSTPQKIVRDVEVEEWGFEVQLEQVCFIIVKARQFDAKEEEVDPDDASNGADDGMIEVLEDTEDDPVRAELIAFIGALNDDAQIDLVALAWIGRGDGDRSDWDDLRQEAEARHHDRPRGVGDERTASYLLGLPLLADYLEEGLATFGQSCLALEADHL